MGAGTEQAAAKGRGPAFFHGGRPGLRRGDILRPPAETGVITERMVLERLLPWLLPLTGQRTSRPDRVYVGDGAIATMRAAAWTVDLWRDGTPGSVYQVVPGGQVEQDPCPVLPGSPPGTRYFSCEYATISRVTAPAITRGVIARFGLADPQAEPYQRLVHDAWEAGDSPAEVGPKLLALCRLIHPAAEPYLRVAFDAWEAGDEPRAELERKLLALRASRRVSRSAVRALGL